MSVKSQPGNVKYVDESCQTLSTGDIVITKIHYKEEQDKVKEKVLTSSPKKWFLKKKKKRNFHYWKCLQTMVYKRNELGFLPAATYYLYLFLY